MLHEVTTEVVGLAKTENSLMREHSKEALLSFNWQRIHETWENKAPKFLSVLEACTDNPSQIRNKKKKDEAVIPKMIAAGCKLLSTFNRNMSLLQYTNSILMLKGGAKKTLFNRFNATGKKSEVNQNIVPLLNVFACVRLSLS